MFVVKRDVQKIKLRQNLLGELKLENLYAGRIIILYIKIRPLKLNSQKLFLCF